MGLAAAKVGLQFNDRVTTGDTRQPFRRPFQQAGKAVGQGGAAEKRLRVGVFTGGAAAVHLGEVGGEFGLLIVAGRHIRVRRDDLAPRRQAGFHADGGGRPRRFAALLVASLFIELGAQDGVTHGAQPVGHLARPDRLHQSPHGIEGPFRIVVGKGVVVRMPVADVGQFVDQRPFGLAKHIAERLCPEAVHDVEQRRSVPLEMTVAVNFQLRPFFLHPRLPVSRKVAFEPAFDKRDQGFKQQFHPIKNMFACTSGHGNLLTSHMLSAVWRSASASPGRGRLAPRSISTFHTETSPL